jgi:hypothetical protein
MTSLDICFVLRRAGYKPHALMTVLGRRLELISYPFPTAHTLKTTFSNFWEHRGAVACMVREPNDPTTMFEWCVPDHVINAALRSFGPTS